MTSPPWLMGIEIGGTKLQLGLARRPAEIEHLERRTIRPERGAIGIRDQIVEAYAALTSAAGLSRGDVAAAGIGFGGPVDADSGRAETSFQVEGWTDFPMADWARKALGVPVVSLHNDADVAGLAESRLGAGVGVSPLLYLTIGSGIGGALIIDGRIYRGAGRGAAEIGHLRVPARGEDGRSTVELEALASGWGIGRLARERAVDRPSSLPVRAGGVDAITAVHVAQAAVEGDPLALEILSEAQDALAFALCQAVALAAPRRIILGGGVSLMGESLWFAPIRGLIDAHVFPPFRGSFDLVPAALGEEVVVHGALELARDALTCWGP